MKIFVRILKNIGIILGVALCVFMVTFAYMFFSQNPVFGYRLRVYSATGILSGADVERIDLQRGYNEKTRITIDSLNGGFVAEGPSVNSYSLTINKVVIETISIPVSIIAVMPLASGIEQSYIKFTDRVISFVEQEDLDSKDDPYRVFAARNGQELRITLNEAPGLAVMNGSLLEIGIDYRFFKNADTSIEVITENSNVTLSKGPATGTATHTDPVGRDNMKLRNFKMKATETKILFGGKGTFSSLINIENLNIENVNGNVNLTQADILGTADITTKKGTIAFGKVSSVNPKAIKVRSENSQVTFGEINGGFSYTGYDTSALRDDRILESKGGKISGDIIKGGLFIKTKDAEFSATVVEGQITSEISGRGKMNIKLYDQYRVTHGVESVINASKGDITISNIINADILTIKTTSGDISVSACGGATAKLNLITGKGKITYNGQTNATGADTINQVTTITTGADQPFAGELTVKVNDAKNLNLNNITGGCLLNVHAEKKVEGTIKFGDFRSGSTIYTDNGKLNIQFKPNEMASLVYNGEKAPSINIRTVNKLAYKGVPTPICGATAATPIGNGADKAALITVTNIKGETNFYV